ncbi:hypothetical protein TNCV_817001 [Trichonephila clavipes]|nr:hypothetical protein TNCV_817001 [Trichonephila clavipes]
MTQKMQPQEDHFRVDALYREMEFEVLHTLSGIYGKEPAVYWQYACRYFYQGNNCGHFFLVLYYISRESKVAMGGGSSRRHERHGDWTENVKLVHISSFS